MPQSNKEHQEYMAAIRKRRRDFMLANPHNDDKSRVTRKNGARRKAALQTAGRATVAAWQANGKCDSSYLARIRRLLAQGAPAHPILEN